MIYYESFILFVTFLLLNLPIFISLYKYVFGELSPIARAAVCVLYWSIAFITNELAPFIGVLVLILMVHRKEEDELQVRNTSIWHLRFRDSIFVVAAALVFKIAISMLNRLYIYFLEQYIGFEARPQEVVEELASGEQYYKLLLFALVVILAPIVEEYIFRYFIYDKFLLPRMPAVAAAILSSALFTLLHMNASGIPTFFGLGLYCTFIYEKKGYYGAVLTHMVSNLVTVLFLM